MSSSNNQSESSWSGNPFPASAVARFSAAGQGFLSISTPAVKQAIAYVDQYLAPTKMAGGNVIAIVGEYGTGKTHLSVEILRRVLASGDETVHSFYLDAPADTFLALYRDRFFVQLDRQDVRQRVVEYYADIVAEELGESPLTAEAARMLAARELQPDQIVQRFGLRESTFLQELQSRLSQITEHEDFGTALALFMRPEFEAAVWEWLAGHPADSSLQERGILRTIDTDISALEAIGVFAFLYGRQKHRFVLIIDEFEKVLSRESRSAREQGSVLAFKKLLEVFSQARSLLVLSGLPDFIEILPEDARQRISQVVRPTSLSYADTRQYIQQSMGDPPNGVAPFTDDSIAYLVDLAGGNARKVIRLCYHAYQSSRLSGTDITRALVREVAREQFEVSTPDDVRAEVTRILDSNGWDFEPAKHITDDSSIMADFWLPVGQSGAGCAVLITQSVLHAPEAETLVGTAQSIRDAKNPVTPIILVVNGYLADNLANLVGSGFSRVMTYAPSRFSDDFSAAIKGFIQRLEASLSEDRIELIESKIEQLLRQTSGVRRSVDGIQRDLPSAVYVEKAVEAGLRRAFGALSGASVAGPTRLRPSTSALFSRALYEVGEFRSIGTGLIQSAFRDAEPDDRPIIVEISGRSLTEFAILDVIERVITTFQESVDEAKGMNSKRSRSSIRQACRVYDMLVEPLVDRARSSLPRMIEAVELGSRIPPRRKIYDGDEIWIFIRNLAQQVYDSEGPIS